MAQLGIILLDSTYSFFAVVGFCVLGFAAGMLARAAVVAKQKKNILKLEDQMLKNHSRILELERTIGNLRTENTELLNGKSHKQGLKAS